MVDADLVGSSGLEPALEQGCVTEAPLHHIVRHGGFAARHHGHPGPLRGVPPDRFVDDAGTGEVTENQRRIVALYAARLQLPHQLGLRLQVRATTSSPLVSLSSRWTMPARGTAASFGSW